MLAQLRLRKTTARHRAALAAKVVAAARDASAGVQSVSLSVSQHARQVYFFAVFIPISDINVFLF